MTVSSSATTKSVATYSFSVIGTVLHRVSSFESSLSSSINMVVDDDGIADGDPAVVEDVRVEPTPVKKILDDPRPRHLLQVAARLTDHDAEALHLAHPEALAHQVVQPHAAHDHLAARLGAGEADILQHLRLDQGHRPAGLRAVAVEIAVALEPLARERADRIDRRDGVGGADVDRLDVHS